MTEFLCALGYQVFTKGTRLYFDTWNTRKMEQHLSAHYGEDYAKEKAEKEAARQEWEDLASGFGGLILGVCAALVGMCAWIQPRVPGVDEHRVSSDVRTNPATHPRSRCREGRGQDGGAIPPKPVHDACKRLRRGAQAVCGRVPRGPGAGRKAAADGQVALMQMAQCFSDARSPRSAGGSCLCLATPIECSTQTFHLPAGSPRRTLGFLHPEIK